MQGASSSVEALREDYQLKVGYLTDHFARLWTRFSFLLSIQLALFGGVGYLLFHEDGPRVLETGIPIMLGLVTAMLWFFVGVQDRYLVEAYREGLIKSFRLLRLRAELEEDWSPTDYVGYHAGLGKTFDYRGWLSWYFKPASVTMLPAWIPLLAIALWMATGFAMTLTACGAFSR